MTVLWMNWDCVYGSTAHHLSLSPIMLNIPVFLKDRYRFGVKNAVQNAKVAKQRASKRRSTPLWLTQDDVEAIEYIYLQCQSATRRTGVVHHVDHIIPLRGKLVCGLHVPSNLRVITARDNMCKGAQHTN